MSTPPLADAPRSSTAADGRPDFIARLGLLLPCSTEDVEAAYRDRAKEAHPDAGGTVAAFTQLQADYESALDYARFHASRRGWLGANIERYAAQQDVIAQIERRGGSVELERPQWIVHEIGEDFAQLLDTVTAVRLSGPAIELDDIDYLASHRDSLAQMHRLDLSGSRIGNRAIEYLSVFPTLHELDLSGTFVSNRAVAVLAEMPALRRVVLAETFVTWQGRFSLKRRRPDLEVMTRCDKNPRIAKAKQGYRWMFRALLVYVLALIFATHSPAEPELVRHISWPGLDKVAHFGIYCGLTGLLAFVVALRSTDCKSRTGLSALGYIAIATFVALFAAADEITQPWTGRQDDIWDWVADMVGMSCGLILFTVIQLYWRGGRRTTQAFHQRPSMPLGSEAG